MLKVSHARVSGAFPGCYAAGNRHRRSTACVNWLFQPVRLIPEITNRGGCLPAGTRPASRAIGSTRVSRATRSSDLSRAAPVTGL
jgi:hypothetical protein